MKFRIYCRPTPGHVHCKVWLVTEDNGMYEEAWFGSLTAREGAEIDALMARFNAEFVDEETGQPIEPKPQHEVGLA